VGDSRDSLRSELSALADGIRESLEKTVGFFVASAGVIRSREDFGLLPEEREGSSDVFRLRVVRPGFSKRPGAITNHCSKPPHIMMNQPMTKSEGSKTFASIKTIDARKKKRPVGKVIKSINANIALPASTQVLVVPAHIVVPMKKIAMAAAIHAVFRQVLI